VTATEPRGDKTDFRPLVYERVCESYHAIDDFRMKLLGLLPLATGAGVLILVNANVGSDEKSEGSARWLLGAIGLFGLVTTLGLFAYELHGIKKCHYLIVAGRYLEHEFDVHGQFSSRPHDVGGRHLAINEPFASSIIYPATLAAWAFTGLVVTSRIAATTVALTILLVGFSGSRAAMRRLRDNADAEIRRTEGGDPPPPPHRLRVRIGDEAGPMPDG
jgi:divalent metal cation (Fe/Co/Zn/Cd) transporter